MEVLPQLLNDVTGAEISGCRLFATLFYVYPITMVQRLLLHGANANLHHIYYTLTSAILLYFNFGKYTCTFLLFFLAIAGLCFSCGQAGP